jgi:DNA helicase HerA-like ATPase
MTVVALGARNKAQIVAVMGASGSGKSTFLKQIIRKTLPSRLLIWDPMTEYGDFGEGTRTLSDVMNKMRANIFAIDFLPSSDPEQMKKQFDLFCQLAFAAGNLTLIAEELAFVTSPSYAPPGWAAVTLKGRHKGLKVYGASQRPASIDKHFFSNATKVRTGRLNYAADIKTLANVLSVQPEQIQGLLQLEYLERDMSTGKVTAGKLAI